MVTTKKKDNSVLKRRVDLIKTYKKLFNSDDGKLIIYDLMKVGNFLRPTAGKNEMDTLLNEGKRELCLYILEMLEKNLDEVLDIYRQQHINECNYFKDGE